MNPTDIVIIGGGVAGLVAACTLAQRGRAVHLVEQHYLPGGCCTTFRRRGYRFDAAVHAIGGCGPDGPLRTILQRLDVWSRLELVRADPMDCIISGAVEVPVHAETEVFLETLCRIFPEERDGLRALVGELVSFGPESFARWGRATYREFLGIIDDEADRLQALIDNLLDSSRLQSGTLPMKFQKVELDVVLRDMIQRTQLGDFNIEVDFQIEDAGMMVA